MTEIVDQVYNWIWQLGKISGITPPFCLQINLFDGSKFYFHSIQAQEEQTQSLVMRVWDLRSFTPEEIESLKEKLKVVENRSKLENPREIHPKLDWADVRLHLQNINYAIEWNDHLFPREERKKLMGLIPAE
jgi:hypothetical protein